MRIAYCRLSMQFQLDFTVAHQGLSEQHFYLFKGLLEAGHRITIYTPIMRADEDLLFDAKNTKKSIVKKGIRLDWVKGLEYSPFGYPTSSNTDLLIVENGPCNLLFWDRHQQSTQLRRICNILKRYEGLVFYDQSDPLLPFPFVKLGKAKYEFSHPKNIYQHPALGYKTKLNKELYGWGDYDEIFPNKKYVVLGRTKNLKGFAEYCDGWRYQYKKLKIPLEWLPNAYSKDISKVVKFNKNPKHTLGYLGYARARRQCYRKYFMGYPDIDRIIYGPWDNATGRKLLQESCADGIEYGGFIPNFADVPIRANECKCTVNLIPDKVQKLGWVAHRLFENIHCGVIVFGCNETYRINDYLNEGFVLKDREHAGAWYKFMKDYSWQKRKRLHEQQYDGIKKYTPEYVVQHLERLYKKHAC